jgi:hypothetical protein
MSATQSLLWVLGFYLLPSLVAFWRRSRERWMALVVNVGFGWTILGWFFAWFFVFSGRER